jgi:ring-1,2-phenylacetyl-CoA epoxidase subunit PaaC
MQALIDHILSLADDALILGHRNSEWTGNGPILEQDIAISNIALDLIGQARNFYQYAARLIDQQTASDRQDQGNAGSRQQAAQGAGPITEDALAYLRDAWDFKNCLLVEQANGDWARTILRQFFFSAYQFYLYDQLRHSRDGELAAISAKAIKEVTYHLRWSSEWVIRLGDGTAESHRRMEKALGELWPFTGELFRVVTIERQRVEKDIGADLSLIELKWDGKVKEVFTEATLAYPSGAEGNAIWMQTGGREGRHTEHLGYLLADMQFLQRAYPGCEW